MFNPVAPYGCLLPNIYLFIANITNPDLFVVSLSSKRRRIIVCSFNMERVCHCGQSYNELYSYLNSYIKTGQ